MEGIYSFSERYERYFEYRARMEKEVVLKDDFITLHGWYHIGLDRIKTPRDLLGWVHHLSEKTWFTTELCNEFIERIAELKNFDLRTP